MGEHAGPGSAEGPPRDDAEPERPPDDARERRPLIERLGLALVAIVIAALFAGVAAAAWVSGEVFLAAMGAIGCLMTTWVGALTLLRG